MKKSYVQAQRRREDGQRYRHDLGQHFLRDETLLRALVAASGVSKEDRVLEIGPGEGTLTRCLAEAAGQVVAVEADESVLPFLRLAVESYSNVTLVQNDARRVDFGALMEGRPFKVVANLPYNITTPLLELFWEGGLPVTQLSVMVQKEVADKLLALPGDDAYGLTSLKCRYYCEPERVMDVPASAFTPPPKVDSAFVNLPFRSAPIAPVADAALLWRMVRAAFNLRRKTLSNALKGIAEADALMAALTQLGLPLTVRGEALTLENWISLSNVLSAKA